jgi:3-methyladenine DNA glycosylase Mpg
VDLTSPGLHFLPRAPGEVPEIAVSARIGVDYAKEWKDAPLRYYDAGSAAVSGMGGKKRPLPPLTLPP